MKFVIILADYDNPLIDKVLLLHTKFLGILFKFRGKLICSKNILLILLCFIFLKFKFFSFTTEFE